MRTKCILKVLVVAVFILGGTLFSAADPLTVMEPISFQVGWHDHSNAQGVEIKLGAQLEVIPSEINY